MPEPQLPPNDFAARLQVRIALLKQQNAALRQEQAQLVPIFIEDSYYGCVAFDDCVDYRQWST